MRNVIFLALLTWLLMMVCTAGLCAQGQTAALATALPESPGALAVPEAPEATRAELAPPIPAVVVPVIAAAPAVAEPAPRPKKIVDGKYVFLGAMVWALTIADVEMTQHCLHAGTCYEMNPTLPHSRLGMYAVNAATNTAVMYFAYRRRRSGKWGWWVAPVVDIGAHGVGVGSNLRFAF